MKISTKIVLLDEKDEPLKDGDAADAKELTLGRLVSCYLLFNSSTDPLRSFELGTEFAKKEEVELESKDVQFIRTILVSPMDRSTRYNYAPIVVGQVIGLLEQKTPAETK